MINISHIYAFLELLEKRNFNAAAESLHLTQSGLSRKINAIEERVDQRLFERTTRLVRPTRAALTLARHWTEAIAHYQAGLAEISSPDFDLSGPFLVGVSATSRYGEWQNLSDMFVKAFPTVTVRIETMPSQDVAVCVRNGDLHVGFCGGPITDEKLGVVRIEQIRYRALLSEQHPLASRQSLHLKDLQGASVSLVSAKTWPRVREPLDALFARHGLQVSVGFESNFLDLVLKHIIEHGGIGVHPVAKNYLLPRGVAFAGIADLDLILENFCIWRKSSTSPVVRSMVNLVRRQFA
ncbi:LysR family transcriptional regulator [Cupriavidus sp. TMH.W2]|uniref:LysR family transcriptional regulator n=1 Tax=Cupriavidus sp. TMH.W2 TaxID=3434465 RepID=UPI003D7711CD